MEDRRWRIAWRTENGATGHGNWHVNRDELESFEGTRDGVNHWIEERPDVEPLSAKTTKSYGQGMTLSCKKVAPAIAVVAPPLAVARVVDADEKDELYEAHAEVHAAMCAHVTPEARPCEDTKQIFAVTEIGTLITA